MYMLHVKCHMYIYQKSKYHQGEVILAPEPKGGAKGDEVPNNSTGSWALGRWFGLVNLEGVPQPDP